MIIKIDDNENIKKTIGRMLEYDPENRPTYEELLDLIMELWYEK